MVHVPSTVRPEAREGRAEEEGRRMTSRRVDDGGDIDRVVGAACTAGGGTDERPRPSIPTRSTRSARSRCGSVQRRSRGCGRPGGLRCASRNIPITIDVTTSVEDDAKVLAAIRAGTPPTTRRCHGHWTIWRRLWTPARGRTSPRTSSRTGWSSRITSRRPWSGTGLRRQAVAFPFLTDAVGLSYRISWAKGYTEPPKPAELTAMPRT